VSSCDLGRLRAVPLAEVLERLGAVRDARDRARWKTPRGALSVTGTRFFNWHEQSGGGGAIDLVMHLRQADFRMAVAWLRDRFARALPATDATVLSVGIACPQVVERVFRPPERDDRMLARVVRYLEDERAIPPEVLAPLLAAGTVYADRRGNAVFVHVDRAGRPAGAELRGTTGIQWRGMAAGSKKAAGSFAADTSSDYAETVLCESAIDAMSCHALRPAARAVSTAGTCSGRAWLADILAPGLPVWCGFDTDEPGETAARAMISRHPAIRRLRPSAHDWNDDLKARPRALRP
jgi:hypothetical protein